MEFPTTRAIPKSWRKSRASTTASDHLYLYPNGARIDEFYSGELAYFLQKLKAIPEGNGSLLDNCMIVYGGGISDPDAHSHDNLPVILAGGGGGTLKRGRHLRVSDGKPMCNLYVSMMQRMGQKLDRFGDSTGDLQSIS